MNRCAASGSVFARTAAGGAGQASNLQVVDGGWLGRSEDPFGLGGMKTRWYVQVEVPRGAPFPGVTQADAIDVEDFEPACPDRHHAASLTVRAMSANELSVLSWNVNGEGGISDETVERQVDFLRSHASDVDLFLLQAVNYEATEASDWGGQLGAYQRFFSSLGYEVVHTADWARELYHSEIQPHQDIHGPHDRCNLTASRWPIERVPLQLREKGPRAPTKLTFFTATFPEKLLVTEIDVPESHGGGTTDVWNVGIIHGAGWGEEKLKMLESVYSRIYLQNQVADRPLVLGGDFNAPKREEPGITTPHGENKPEYTNYPFYGDPYYFRNSMTEEDVYTFRDRWETAERLIFDPEVGRWDMSDAYWAADASSSLSSTEDYTHIIENANPSRKRLDHVFVSDEFSVEACELWNGEGGAPDGLGPSDHAPVMAVVRL